MPVNVVWPTFISVGGGRKGGRELINFSYEPTLLSSIGLQIFFSWDRSSANNLCKVDNLVKSTKLALPLPTEEQICTLVAGLLPPEHEICTDQDEIELDP